MKSGKQASVMIDSRNFVAAMVSQLAGPVFDATTGAQIPIDGGSDCVI